MRISLAAVVFFVALGCQRQPAATTGLSGGLGVQESSTGEASTSMFTSAASSTADSTSSASAAGTSSSTTEGLRHDMGTPDLPPGSACNGKIDLVFVITQTGHFGLFIDTLYDSYPEILATIQETFADFDLHVMFADPNDRWAANHVCPKGMCPEEGGCPVEGWEDFPCWVFYDEEALTKCDNTVGAGVRFPAGESASNLPCDLPEGQRYIDGDDPLFAERFDCISHTGIAGSTSMPGWALGEAVSLDLQEGCNAGFFRDDALLFAVIVSTHDYSPFNPYVWAQRVLEAKEDNQDMIVALGIADDWKTTEAPLCEPGSIGDEPDSIYKWTKEFDHSLFGSVCAPSFAPFFAEAATMAADLCANGSQN